MRGRRGPGLIGTAVVVGGAAHMGAKSAQKSGRRTQAQQPAAPQQAARAGSHRPSPTTLRKSRSTQR